MAVTVSYYERVLLWRDLLGLGLGSISSLIFNCNRESSRLRQSMKIFKIVFAYVVLIEAYI